MIDRPLDDLDDKPKPSFTAMFKFWESNRIQFNFLMLIVGFVLFIFEYFFKTRTDSYWEAYINEAILAGIMINVFYSGIYLAELKELYTRKALFTNDRREKYYKYILSLNIVLLIMIGSLSIGS